MKLKTVVLLGLVAAHLNASALPNMCVKGYREATDILTQDYSSLEAQKKGTVAVGVGGGIALLGTCAWKARSVGSGVACAVVFSAILFVTNGYRGELEKKMDRVVGAAFIYQLFRDIKAGHDSGALAGTLNSVTSDRSKDEVIKQMIVKMMEDGTLCNGQARPNLTVQEFLELIRSRI